MRALSIRQPYAELILRGENTIEYRSTPTRIIGEPFYIYAAIKEGDPEAWIQLEPDPIKRIELATLLATGLILGKSRIAKCIFCPANGHGARYEWHLSDVERLKQPLKPKRMPQPVWFRP